MNESTQAFTGYLVWLTFTDIYNLRYSWLDYQEIYIERISCFSVCVMRMFPIYSVKKVKYWSRTCYLGWTANFLACRNECSQRAIVIPLASSLVLSPMDSHTRFLGLFVMFLRHGFHLIGSLIFDAARYSCPSPKKLTYKVQMPNLWL